MQIIRTTIIALALYAIVFLISVSIMDADFLFFIVPFICIVAAFLINKILFKKLSNTLHSADAPISSKITKATFIKLSPFTVPLNIVLVGMLADTSFFSYGNKYGSKFHLLNGRDFIQTPTIIGTVFILIGSIISTYFFIYIYWGIKRVFTFKKE